MHGFVRHGDGRCGKRSRGEFRAAARARRAPGAHPADVVAGGVAVALKRASLFGRAPVAEDLRVAFDLFGFLTLDVSDELVARRRQLFTGVAGDHNYRGVRRIADLPNCHNDGCECDSQPVKMSR